MKSSIFKIRFFSKNYIQIQQLKNLSQTKIFLFGLFLKIILIKNFYPEIQAKLFLPFIENFFNNISIDPWSRFLELSENINSFPLWNNYVSVLYASDIFK